MSGVRRKFFTNDQYVRDLSDRVTVGGARIIYVPQEDGHWPPYAEVLASKMPSRQPHDPNGWESVLRSLREWEPEIYPVPKDHKFCSCCGEFVPLRYFSPHPGTKSGLQSWCKSCRNNHARRMYWMAKEEQRLREQGEERIISLPRAA